MSYTDGKGTLRLRTAAGLDAILAQTPADKANAFVGPEPIMVSGIAAIITVAMTVTASVWTLRHRPTPGSETGATVLATVTLPVTGSAIGDCVYKRFTPFKVPAGGELVLALTTASTAGAAAWNMEMMATTDAPGNNAKMKASA